MDLQHLLIKLALVTQLVLKFDYTLNEPHSRIDIPLSFRVTEIVFFPGYHPANVSD